MIVKLSEIFIPNGKTTSCKRPQLVLLQIRDAFIDALIRQLDLGYAESEAHSVCFASSIDVQEAYRTSFNKYDICQYVFGCLGDEPYDLESDGIPLPSNAEVFWEIIGANKI